jgi:lipoyl(octanoyl) transferase
VTPIRLLIDPPAAGPWNMAVDETLLEAAADGAATLRFYQWSPATLSLGYFQAAADREQHAASRDCPLVRRASGGGAILHDRELTYSIALPRTATALSATALYDAFHETLVATLSEFEITAARYRSENASCDPAVRRNDADPFLCFQRRSCGDVVCGPWKIAGSAQRRRRGAVLQHGSILLSRSPLAPELPGIAELTGISLSPARLIDAWTPRLATRLPATFELADLDERRRSRAEELARSRFGRAAFTLQR